MKIIAILLTVAMSVAKVTGHGYLLQPPARNTMWRSGFASKSNYNDNALNCGGSWNQWEVNGGKCGICGDPYQGPLEHEAGGKFATLDRPVTRCFNRHDDAIDVHVVVTAHHKGYFEFRLCEHNSMKTRASQSCFDNGILLTVRSTGQTRYDINKIIQVDYLFQLYMPQNVTCTQCILQWKYNTGNSWGCDNTGCGGGLGSQEQFINCADIAISENCSVSPMTSTFSTGSTTTDGPTSTPSPPNTTTDVPKSTLNPQNTTIDVHTSTPDPPNTTTHVPTSTPDPPNTTTDVPTSTPDPPNTTTDVPKSTPDPPNTTTDVPTSTLDPPNTTTDVPTSTPDLPNTTMDVPTRTPVPPNTTTHVPTSTPDPPNTTTDVPTSTPDPTNATTHVPTSTPDPTNTTMDVPTSTPDPTNTTTHVPTSTPDPTNVRCWGVGDWNSPFLMDMWCKVKCISDPALCPANMCRCDFS